MLPVQVPKSIASCEPTDRRQLHNNSLQASVELLALLEQVADSGMAANREVGPTPNRRLVSVGGD